MRKTSGQKKNNKAIGGDGLENFVAGLGTERDKRSYTRWGVPRVLTRQELENAYRTSWLAKRIINTVADDMTSKWRKFVFADADDNPQLKQLEDEEKRLQIKAKVNEASKWARLYGGCMILLGVGDAKKPGDFRKPLDFDRIKQGDLKYLHVVDRWRCAPTGTRVRDLMDPAFGLPEFYTLSDSADTNLASSTVIHHTRLLKFDGARLPYYTWLSNGFWHDSILQHVIESLLNYDTSSAAIASMLFEANIDVVQSEGLTELLASKDGESKLLKRFQLGAMMKSFNRTLLLDSTEKYEKKQNQFSNLDKVWEQFMVDVSGAAEMPMSKLFGTSPSGLNSSGDGELETYYGKIESDREAQLTPELDKLDKALCMSTLGSVPKDFQSVWNPLWQLSETDQSTIDYQNAQRDQIYLTTGVVSEGLVASELKARGTYRSMSSEDVKLAEELGEQMDEHQETLRENQQVSTDPKQMNKMQADEPQPKDKKEAKKK